MSELIELTLEEQEILRVAKCKTVIENIRKVKDSPAVYTHTSQVTPIIESLENLTFSEEEFEGYYDKAETLRSITLTNFKFIYDKLYKNEESMYEVERICKGWDLRSL